MKTFSPALRLGLSLLISGFGVFPFMASVAQAQVNPAMLSAVQGQGQQAGGGMGSIAAGADPPHAEGAKLDQAQILKSQIYSDHIYLMY